MSESLFILLSREEAGYDLKYTVILRPGEVRYIRAKDFFLADVDNVIAEIQRGSNEPKVDSPYPEFLHRISGVKYAELNFYELDKLLEGIAWDNRLRVHHALGGLVLHIGMSSWAYCEFHRYLKLGSHFAIAECAEAWVRDTASDWDLAKSFISSPRHLVIEHGTLKYAVFLKSAFVQAHLDSLMERDRLKSEEAARKVEQAQAEEEVQRTAALTEQLRRSRFTTFVYLMEDPRNGAFKIGHSKTPGRRERTLQSEVPETLLRFSIPAEEAHEKTLHSRFRHRHIRGEWFGLTPEDLVEVIAFLKANGDSERATADFQWIGKLFLSSPPSR